MTGHDTDQKEALKKELLEIADRMSAMWLRATAEQMNRSDLSHNQGNALRVLQDGEPLTMSALAERLQVSTAAVTSIVDKLEAERLALRSRSKEDRRQVLVRATPRGIEAVQRLFGVRNELIQYTLDNISPEMRQHWLELYREMEKLFSTKLEAMRAESQGAK
ncbi:MAG: MarR family transcriptional regulator [Verrucomicrobia bacterium]|nr:MarR family transcriptional regulator [Verrucomicrobiota bacterium]